MSSFTNHFPNQICKREREKERDEKERGTDVLRGGKRRVDKSLDVRDPRARCCHCCLQYEGEIGFRVSRSLFFLSSVEERGVVEGEVTSIAGRRTSVGNDAARIINPVKTARSAHEERNRSISSEETANLFHWDRRDIISGSPALRSPEFRL